MQFILAERRLHQTDQGLISDSRASLSNANLTRINEWVLGSRLEASGPVVLLYFNIYHSPLVSFASCHEKPPKHHIQLIMQDLLIFYISASSVSLSIHMHHLFY